MGGAEAHLAAQGLLVEFFRALDDNRYSDMADMLEGGVWHRRGVAIDTRAALMAAMEGRSQTRVIRHVLTNVSSASDEEEVAVTAYMMVFQQEPGQALDGPAPMPGISTIRTVHCRAAAGPGGWRICDLRSDPAVFQA